MSIKGFTSIYKLQIPITISIDQNSDRRHWRVIGNTGRRSTFLWRTIWFPFNCACNVNMECYLLQLRSQRNRQEIDRYSTIFLDVYLTHIDLISLGQILHLILTIISYFQRTSYNVCEQKKFGVLKVKLSIFTRNRTITYGHVHFWISSNGFPGCWNLNLYHGTRLYITEQEYIFIVFVVIHLDSIKPSTYSHAQPLLMLLNVDSTSLSVFCIPIVFIFSYRPPTAFSMFSSLFKNITKTR